VRARTSGEGGLVEVSLLGAALAIQVQDLVWLEGEAAGPSLAAARSDLTARADEIAGGLAMNPYYRCFEAADGFLAVACLNVAQRRAFLELFGLADATIEAPDLVPDDPRVLDGKQRVTAAVERAIRAQPVEAWLARFSAADIPAGPVLVRESVHADAQVRANGLVQEIEQPGLGRVAVLGGVFRLDSTDSPGVRPAPTLGADTEDVLREVGA
jgi:crotonobetainyl-CoA:carnitine CoA-transferase CaiB-like acyl-CoA transferase